MCSGSFINTAISAFNELAVASHDVWALSSDRISMKPITSSEQLNLPAVNGHDASARFRRRASPSQPLSAAMKVVPNSVTHLSPESYGDVMTVVLVVVVPEVVAGVVPVEGDSEGAQVSPAYVGRRDGVLDGPVDGPLVG